MECLIIVKSQLSRDRALLEPHKSPNWEKLVEDVVVVVSFYSNCVYYWYHTRWSRWTSRSITGETFQSECDKNMDLDWCCQHQLSRQPCEDNATYAFGRSSCQVCRRPKSDMIIPPLKYSWRFQGRNDSVEKHFKSICKKQKGRGRIRSKFPKCEKVSTPR